MRSNSEKWWRHPIYERPLGLQEPVAGDERETVLITDFSKCLPSDQLTRVADAGRWQIRNYATERFSGHALTATRSNPAAEVTIPLPASGWYAIYVWLMGGDVDLEPDYPNDFDSVYSMSNGPALKLTQDQQFWGNFRTLSHDRMMWPGVEPVFWRYVDLNEDCVSIRHQGCSVFLAALELIPLTTDEVQRVEHDRRQHSTRPLLIKGDHPDPVAGAAMLPHFRDTDVAGWICGNEDDGDLFSDKPAKLGWAREQADALGIALYICDRPSLWSSHWHREGTRIDFAEQHPEWRCLDRDGTPTHQFSYAVPEVVEHMLARARASTRVQPDGIGFFFNRDPGLVLFEPAAMAGFEEQHGVDPLTLDDRDERLLAWRANIITDFLRKVRRMLDGATGENSKRIEILAVVLGDEAANRFFSYDVATWVREGLVDILCPYPWTDYPDRWLAQGFVDVDVPYFADIVRGTACRLFPMWLTGSWRQHWTPEHVQMKDYFKKATADYAAGAYGLTIWDTVGLNPLAGFKASRWLRLGHHEQLDDWIAEDFPLPPKLRFSELDGNGIDRYPQGTGG